MASPLSLWEHGYPIQKDLPFMKWDMILDILRASEEIATPLSAVECTW